MQKDIKIIVAAHKKYEMPKDKVYMPIHVGAEGKKEIGYQCDNIGKNISKKNPYFCELTGLYWAWKNIKSDYIGIAHYRRHFKGKNKSKNKFDTIINSEEINELFNKTDIILPKKRNYYIETLYSHYEHTMYVEPLDIAGKIIQEKYPKYVKEFNKLKERKAAHMFNMFIMKKNIADDYCKWLFDILFELEKRVDVSKYDSFHARFYGRVSELLLDVWINTNKLDYKEIPVIYMEKINYKNKIISFLKAKFLGEKYGKSF